MKIFDLIATDVATCGVTDSAATTVGSGTARAIQPEDVCAKNMRASTTRAARFTESVESCTFKQSPAGMAAACA